MQFFIDSAHLAEIKEAHSLGILDGVTTNPSLMAKAGIKGKVAIANHYKAICNLVDDKVSAEVIATDFKGMMQEAEVLAKIDDKIVVKIPMIQEGLKAIKALSRQSIRTNCTLMFTSGQAMLAAKAGATYVSPFIGRLDDITTNGIALVEQIVHIFDQYDFETAVLAASIRHPMHVIQCAEIGVDVVTCPLKTIISLLHHPLTDKGLAQFLRDHQK